MSGEAALKKFSPERREQALRLLNRYDVWGLILGAILPPPFPLKIVLISAGVFRMRAWRYILALAATGFTAFNALMYAAAHSTGAVNLTILQGAIPIFVLIGGLGILVDEGRLRWDEVAEPTLQTLPGANICHVCAH